jgi:predicted lipoprotein with Yx(FWY)xxD motif
MTMAALAVLAAVSIAALGGDTAVAKASSAKTTIAALKIKGLGAVLVDSHKMTLYTLTNNGQAVPCDGQCAAAWPPLKTSAGSTPKPAKGITGIGVTGTGTQVTADGLPLYRYSGDAKSGQANGEDISSYGGVWHVVKTSAPAASAKGSSSSGSSGSSGYGY